MERKNATLLGMYAGNTRIDGPEHKHSTLLKGIAGFAKITSDGIKVAFGALFGASAGPFVVKASLVALGFGGFGQGIVTGTPAAALMAPYGGSVGAGTACAVLQSVAAAGLGVAGTAPAAGVGALVGGFGVYRFFTRR